MTVERMEHIGIVVDDLTAAVEFFRELGLESHGDGSVDGDWVDRIVGLEGIQTDFAMMKTPDGDGALELIRFRSPLHEGEREPAPANVPGLRHLAFIVDDVDDTVARLEAHGGTLVGEVVQFENMFRLCYLRGPAGIIVELAERVD